MISYLKFKKTPTHRREQMRIAWLSEQGGACALCPRSVTPEDRHELLVDHCHRTGWVRGLLCSSCNLAMAAIDRGDEWIARAIAYRDAVRVKVEIDADSS